MVFPLPPPPEKKRKKKNAQPQTHTDNKRPAHRLERTTFHWLNYPFIQASWPCRSNGRNSKSSRTRTPPSSLPPPPRPSTGCCLGLSQTKRKEDVGEKSGEKIGEKINRSPKSQVIPPPPPEKGGWIYLRPPKMGESDTPPPPPVKRLELGIWIFSPVRQMDE